MIYDLKYFLRYLNYTGSKIENDLTRFRADLVINKAMPHIKMRQHPDVVDYGCSHGAFIKEMKMHHGIRAIGVDINPYCVSYCVKNGYEAYTSEMFDHFYEGVPIQIMTFWDVLEHLRDPAAMLGFFKPSAICTSLPCLDGWIENHPGSDVQCSPHWRPLEHLWNFTEKAFVEYISHCGYDVVYTTFEESKIRVNPLTGDKNIMSFVAVRR